MLLLLVGSIKEVQPMNTIQDISNPDCWVEHDMSAELEAEQVKYDREHRDQIEVSVVPEEEFDYDEARVCSCCHESRDNCVCVGMEHEECVNCVKKPVLGLSEPIGELNEALEVAKAFKLFLIDLGVKEGEKFRKEHGREPTEFEAGIIAQTILQQAKVALALSKGVRA